MFTVDVDDLTRAILARRRPELCRKRFGTLVFSDGREEKFEGSDKGHALHTLRLQLCLPKLTRRAFRKSGAKQAWYCGRQLYPYRRGTRKQKRRESRQVAHELA